MGSFSNTTRAAPIFQLRTIDGNRISLTSFRGKLVRLWFMAACPTCVGQSEAQGFIIFLTYALEVDIMMTIISTLRGISNQKFARHIQKNWRII